MAGNGSVVDLSSIKSVHHLFIICLYYLISSSHSPVIDLYIQLSIPYGKDNVNSLDKRQETTVQVTKLSGRDD